MADLGMLIKIQASGASSAEIEIDRVSASADKLEKKSKEAERKVDDLGRSLSSAGHSAKDAGRYFDIAAKAAAGFVSIQIVRNMFNVADSYRAMAERVKMATNSLAEFEYVQERLVKSTQTSYRSLEEAQEMFIMTSGNLRDVGYSLGQSLDITDSLSFAFVRNATSAQRAEAAINNYDKALSSGMMNGEQWRVFSGAVETVAKNIGDVYGKTALEIDRMGHDGLLAIQMINEGLRLSLNENKDAADSMANTVVDGQTRVQAAFEKSWAALNEGLEITSTVTGGLIYVADNFEGIGKVAGAVAVGGVAYLATGMAITAFEATKAGIASLSLSDKARILRNSTIQAAVAAERGAYATAKSALALERSGGSYTKATAAAMNHARALHAVRSAQSMSGGAISGLARLLGGPVGIASLAVSAASAFYLFSDSAKDTKVSLDEIIEPIESIILKFKEMDEISRIEFIKKTSEQELAALALVEDGYASLGLAISRTLPSLHGLNQSRGLDVWVKKEFELAAATGEDLLSVINRVSEKTGIPAQWIIERSDGLNGLIKQFQHYNKIKEEALGSNEDKSVFEQALTANKDAMSIYNDISKKMFEINSSGMEGVLITKKNMGELEGINDTWFGILTTMAKAYDQQLLMKQNEQSLDSLLAGVKEQYDNIGKSVHEIARAKLIANSIDLGIDPEKLKELEGWLDAIGNAPKPKSGSSKTSLNYFDDALKSIGDELIAIKAMNQDLVIFGDPNQYNAVKDMTAQLNDQKGVLAGITASQREILLLKAQELDSQKQINAILNLQNDYKHRFEDLAFELDLIGLTKKEVEKLTFFRDLDNEAKLISIGMSKENAEALQAEIEKIKELYGAYQAVKEERENDPIQGIRDGLNGFMDEAGSARSAFEDATKGALYSMASGLADFVATGKTDFKSLTQSILQDISKILAQWAIAQAMGVAFGMLPGFSGGGSVGAPVRNTGMGSFDSGGYTGFGGKYDPAGIVHRDEYVMDQDTTRALGVPFLDSLRRSAKSGKGYANGGYVGSSVPMGISGQSGSQRSDIVVNQTLHIESGANIDEQMIKKLQYEMRKEAMRISENISLRTIGDQKRSGGMLRG